MLLRAILAALVGTVAMTLSSETEMKIRGRPASTAPGQAVAKLLGFVGIRLEGRPVEILATWTHWIYGSAWGIVFWLLIDVAALSLGVTAVLYFLIVWGAEQVHLPLLGVAPPPWRWGIAENAIDAWHHVAYVAGTVVGWVLLGLLP